MVETLSIDALASENQILRDELAKVRLQIDRMFIRTEDLTKENRELTEMVQKLTDSKSELEELQSQKDALFGMLMHDIKNPAGVIKSLVDLLNSYDLSASEQQDVIKNISETTNRIVSLSQEVSRMLALESGKLTLRLDFYHPLDIVNSIFRCNAHNAKNKNITIQIEIPKELPEIQCDGQKIEEVVDNLLSNAVKYSHAGSEIKIRSFEKNGGVVIEVCDNGQGLSQDDIKKAFARGAELSARPTAGEHSSGLGLWIVKKMIEAHNGKVWVRSVLGKGSTFSVHLPMYQQDPDTI